MGMREGFRKITSLVVALAVLLTLAALTVPTWGTGLNGKPHTDHCVCGKTDCSDHAPVTSWTEIDSFDNWNDAITGVNVETMSLGIDNNSVGFSSEEDSAEIATYAVNDSNCFYLTKDVTLTSPITIGSGVDVTLCLNGKTITAASNSRIFTIESGGSLTVCDCSGGGVITGGKLYDPNVSDDDDNKIFRGGAVSVDKNGAFTMYGGTISGNSAKEGGGVYNVGTFTMYGGTISDNSAKHQGGGVYNSGTFTMSGGSTISGNEVEVVDEPKDYGGGGVYTSGEFTMSDDGMISGNKANSCYGGGVCVSVNGVFTMSGGTISKNGANYGGGVYLSGGRFDMTGGTIGSENEADSGGGGVCVGQIMATFTMSGGTISGNTTKRGGGVYVGNGAFNLEGGTIGENNASSDGGGVYLGGGAFTMSNNGEISDNTSKNGGGAYVGNGTFHLEGGTIGENNASGDGGGVYLGGGELAMSNGAISDNASGNGGGVYLRSGEFTMSGGAISDNLAEKNGLGVYVDNQYDNVGGKMTLNGKVNITSPKKDDGSESNVYLRIGKTIIIGKNFSADGEIGICPEKTIICEDPVDVTVFDTGVAAKDISSNFKPDVIGQEIVYQDNKVQLTVKHDFSTTWSHDENDHWHECSKKCGTKNNKANHDWVTVIIPATCLEDGSQKDTCKDCGRTTGVTTLAATGHDWGEWTPSLTDPDIEISVCNNDPAHTQEREITRDPEPSKPSVPSAPPVIRPTVTTVPSGTTTTTVKNTTTTTPPDTTTTMTAPASAKTEKPKKTTTVSETTASGKTTVKTTTPAGGPPATLTIVPAKVDENPKTGVAVSLIPLTAAMIALTVAVKRNRK